MRLRRPLVAAVAVLTLTVINLQFTTHVWAATTYKVLHRFTGTDGSSPVAGVVVDSAGNVYGTTSSGGNLKCNNPTGCGTVFKLDVNGTFTVLHRFHGTDGSYPNSTLALDSQGNLYGTTRDGGSGQEGAIFKVLPDGTFTVLYNSAGGADGFPPLGVVLDPAGNLYGATLLGGGSCFIGSSGCGTIFKLDQTGNKTVLYAFMDGADGGEPFASVIRDSAGNLYGTAHYGGDLGCFENIGCGTVFKLDTSGVFTVLKTFHGGTDGQLPGSGSLVLDAAGNLYGAMASGGTSTNCSGGCGLVFKLTPKADGSWAYSAIHSFSNHPASGPLGGMVFDALGNLYGTSGGGSGGVVFKLAPQPGGSWAYSVVHQFLGTPALSPTNALAIDNAGNLYGTAQNCGSGTGCLGVVFKITP